VERIQHDAPARGVVAHRRGHLAGAALGDRGRADAPRFDRLREVGGDVAETGTRLAPAYGRTRRTPGAVVPTTILYVAERAKVFPAPSVAVAA
jgi:hypothetical protein